MKKLRGLVVDDTVIMRRLVSTVLEGDSRIEVAGLAASGSIALQKLDQLSVDFVTLDVEMPEMDGLATLRAIRQTRPDLPVIMLSLATQRGAVVTLDALAAGASDYVTKPQNVANLNESIERLRAALLPKIHALCASPETPELPPTATKPLPSARSIVRSRQKAAVELLCIGTSTGGPNALSEIFGALRTPLEVPVAIVQHMPPEFTKLLADRIDRTPGAVRCREAEDGQTLEKGIAYLAPGGRHLSIEREQGGFVARLLDTPPENSCRPAVDVLFRSAAKAGAAGVLGVVLTGMGADGANGAELIHDAGGSILIQDEASSVVWGMPGATFRRGIADQVLPLSKIALELTHRCATAEVLPTF